MSLADDIASLLDGVDAGRYHPLRVEPLRPDVLWQESCYRVRANGHPLDGYIVKVLVDGKRFDVINAVLSPSGQELATYGDGSPADAYYPSTPVAREAWGLK